MKLFGRILLAVVLPLAVGCLFILPTITSDNGYVAGFAFLPFFFLTVLLAGAFTLAGLIMTGIKGRPGLWWLPSGPLLVIGFFGLAFIAKQFELGAYREDPMVSIPPPIANRVIFRHTATDEEIERFWTDVIGMPHENGGHSFLPGIASGVRSGDRSITFAFRDGVTEQQKVDVRERIKAYRPVHRYLEDVATKSTEPEPRKSNSSNGNFKKPVKYDSLNSDR